MWGSGLGGLTTEMNFLTVLEVDSPRAKYCYADFLSPWLRDVRLLVVCSHGLLSATAQLGSPLCRAMDHIMA